jgi:hypothetical protein
MSNKLTVSETTITKNEELQSRSIREIKLFFCSSPSSSLRMLVSMLVDDGEDDEDKIILILKKTKREDSISKPIRNITRIEPMVFVKLN